MIQSQSSKKSNGIWIFLIVAPFVALILVALLQIIVHFLTHGPSNNNAFIAIVNIISVLLGMASVLALIGLPVWIVMLIRSGRPAK